MSRIVVAEFSRVDDLMKAIRELENVRILDAFTPFHVEGLAELLELRPSRVPVAMFVGGIAVAASAYWAEWYTAVIDYPINSGGRPLHSWPAFMMFPFAIGILAAAITGFIYLMLRTGLPRLHHPLFEIEGFERASQDRFLLALEPRGWQQHEPPLSEKLRSFGAAAVHEVAS